MALQRRSKSPGATSDAKVLECDYALPQSSRRLKRVTRQRTAVDPHIKVVADGEPEEGQDPPADAAQPETLEHLHGARQSRSSSGGRPALRRGREARADDGRIKGRRRKTVTAGRELVDPPRKKVQPDEEKGADQREDGQMEQDGVEGPQGQATYGKEESGPTQRRRWANRNWGDQRWRRAGSRSASASRRWGCRFTEYGRPRLTSRGATCGWFVAIAKEGRKRGLSFPGPDPGGQETACCGRWTT